ncbi:unnamed protein product, partial [Ectocarpus sp. 8 AP-2014]
MSTSSKKTGGGLALTNAGMRKSCVECTRKKKKCDGMTPCSRCLESGIRCTYMKRKWHQRQPGHQQQPHRRGLAAMQSTDSSSSAIVACGILPLKRYELKEDKGCSEEASTSCVPYQARAFGMVIPRLKTVLYTFCIARFRLSASPATGLVGMQENAFLKDFFGCVGLLPLTTPSHVRGAMVRMMTRSTAQQQVGALHDSPEQGQFGAIFAEDGFTTGNQLLTGPSCCTFWCAVGVGAVMKGSTVESVAKYSRLARDALDAYKGPVNAEVAKAWAILGYFHGSMGDMANYVKYLKLSGSFLIDSIEQESTGMLPAGFAEMVSQKDTVQVYSGHLDAAGIESLGAQRQDAPQIKPAACDGDIYRYVAQSQTAFQQVVFERACQNSAARRLSREDEACEDNRGGANPHGNAPQAEDVSDAMVAGLRDGLIDFEHLQETVDRPNIRTGVGGLFINVTLAFQRAAKGDAGGALESLGHCVEVFELYPGVCRYVILWCHLAHSVLGALAAIDDSSSRGLYTRLREVYNPFRPSSSLPAPPLEEWRGISAFCDDFQCRIYEGIIASQALSVFSTPSLFASNSAGSQGTQCTEEHLQAVDEEHRSSIESAGVTPEDATGSIMVASADKPMASTRSWESYQEPAPHMSPPVRPSLSPSHLHFESVRGSTSDDVFSGGVEGCGGGGVIAGLVPQVSDMPVTSLRLSEVDGTTHGDDAITAADWLDISQAIMDAGDDK